MNYYNENSNKIRRRKVSSNDSTSQPIKRSDGIKKKETINNINRYEKVAYQSHESNTKKRSRKYKKNKKSSKKVIKFISSILLMLLIIGSIGGSLLVISSLKDSPKVTKELIEQNYISSEVVNLNEIPINLKNALVAIEDERFYKHDGVDIISLGRSLMHNIFSESTQGGSTIEMQVSKNLLTNDDRSMKRKIRDIYNAIQIDKIMAKEEILGVYLNNVYFGKSAYGVGKASKVYFGKEVKDLSLAQCAMLIGITNNPAKYSTHTYAKQRQETILYKMNELGYITDEEYKAALREDVPFKSEIQ